MKNKSKLKKLSFLTLLSLLLLANLALFLNHVDRVRTAKSKQVSELEKMTEIFIEKIQSYEYGLQGLAGIYLVLKYYPTDQQIKSYAQSRNYYKNFKGALGFGFIRNIASSELDKYVKNQKQKKSDFQIKNLNEYDRSREHYIIESIEPYSVNFKAIGLNVASESKRFAAAEKARLTRSAIMTDEIVLVQDQEKKQGHLIFKPIFKGNHLVGWVYTPIISSNLIEFLEAKTKLKLKVIWDKNIEVSKDTIANNISVFGKEGQLIAEFDSNPIFIQWALSICIFVIANFGILMLYRRFAIISEKAQEKEFQAMNSEAWKSSIIDSAEYTIISTDPNGIITTFNKKASQLLGYDSTEMIGICTPAVLHDLNEVIKKTVQLNKEFNTQLEPGFETFIFKTLKTKMADTNTWTYIHKNGSRIPVRLTVTVIYDAKNNLVGYLGIGTDITEQIKTENERAGLLRALNNSAIVSTADIYGKIIDVNKKFVEISGYTREELINQDHKILNSGFHTKEFFKDLWLTIQCGKTWSGEIQNKNKNGELYWVHSFITPFFNTEGKIEKFISVRFDITNKKMGEIKMINSAKLASLGEMASGIAHEINNPLAIIQGKSFTIRRMIEKNNLDVEKLKINLEKIENTTERISKIVRGLKTFSRNNNDKESMKEVSLHKILNDCLDLCSEKFKSNLFDLRVDLGVDVNIDCREIEISQVIINLLGNAFDASKDNSEKWICLKSDVVGNFCKISVTDSGGGISLELLEKIMQPFFTTKEVGKGTGLGLSISKGIIESHKGQLYYDKDSKNTRFVVEIPIKQNEKTETLKSAS